MGIAGTRKVCWSACVKPLAQQGFSIPCPACCGAEKAEERKREQDVLYERQMLKERAAEDHLFGDKERFVTAAYKKKLEEDQRYVANQKRM